MPSLMRFLFATGLVFTCDSASRASVAPRQAAEVKKERRFSITRIGFAISTELPQFGDPAQVLGCEQNELGFSLFARSLRAAYFLACCLASRSIFSYSSLPPKNS